MKKRFNVKNGDYETHMDSEKIISEAETEQPKSAPKKLIYIGPQLPGLKPFTSFKDGQISERGQELIKRDEKYKRLFVTTIGFIKAMKEMRQGGLGTIYRDASREKF